MKKILIGIVAVLALGLALQGYLYLSSRKELGALKQQTFEKSEQEKEQAKEQKFGTCVSEHITKQTLTPATLIECYKESRI